MNDTEEHEGTPNNEKIAQLMDSMASSFDSAAKSARGLRDMYMGFVEKTGTEKSRKRDAARFSKNERAEMIEEIANAMIAAWVFKMFEFKQQWHNGRNVGFVSRITTTELFEALWKSAEQSGIAFRFRDAQRLGKWMPKAIERIKSLGYVVQMDRDRDKKRVWTIHAAADFYPNSAEQRADVGEG